MTALACLAFAVLGGIVGYSLKGLLVERREYAVEEARDAAWDVEHGIGARRG